MIKDNSLTDVRKKIEKEYDSYKANVNVESITQEKFKNGVLSGLSRAWEIVRKAELSEEK